MQIDGFINESLHLQCKLSLRSITLDDKRSDAPIQRLLDKKRLNVAKTSKDLFFELFYEQNSNGDKKGICFKVY